MLNNNLITLALTVLIAVVWLRLNDFLAHRGWIFSTLSRKIIYIGTGFIFVLCWLLFKETASAPFIAAVVPLAITDQFALVGTGVIKDPSAVAALSRTGDRREILRGSTVLRGCLCPADNRILAPLSDGNCGLDDPVRWGWLGGYRRGKKWAGSGCPGQRKRTLLVR